MDNGVAILWAPPRIPSQKGYTSSSTVFFVPSFDTLDSREPITPAATLLCPIFRRFMPTSCSHRDANSTPLHLVNLKETNCANGCCYAFRYRNQNGKHPPDEAACTQEFRTTARWWSELSTSELLRLTSPRFHF